MIVNALYSLEMQAYTVDSLNYPNPLQIITKVRIIERFSLAESESMVMH